MFGEGTGEDFEGGLAGPVAIREGNLDEAGVEVADPGLQGGVATSLLRAEGAAVEGVLEGDDDVLAAATGLVAVHAGELDGEFDGL